MGKTKETKQEIMKVTKQLILEKGYAQVTMNDVTRASGMSAGGLYYHYRTIEEIVKDILRTETDVVWETIGRPENADELMTAVALPQISVLILTPSPSIWLPKAYAHIFRTLYVSPF